MKVAKPFQFKQFSIEQDKCSMKVGTDGVLLGGWVPDHIHVNTTLDVGTGSGLIALMLAQKFPGSKIIGIDSDTNSIAQASHNFKQSPWHKNLSAVKHTLQEFYKESYERFDLIVSNPPFHEEKVISPYPGKITSRSTLSLPFEDLISCSSVLMKDNGHFALIAPFQYEAKLLDLGRKNHLYPVKLTRVRGNKTADIKRILILFSNFEKTSPIVDEILLEESRHQFSPDYIALTQEYYLHL